MQKHVHFWTGVFVTLFLSVPLAMGIAGIAIDEAKRTALSVLSMMCVLVVLLVLVLANRDHILRFITGRTESSLDEIASGAFDAIGAAYARDKEQSAKQIARLVSTIVNWYSWSGFYRWVIGTLTAILVVFTGLAGTVLLLDQNKKLGEQTNLLEKQNTAIKLQNSIMTLNTISGLRERLGRHGEDPKPISIFDGFTLVFGYDYCALTSSNVLISQPTNPSEISAIQSLAAKKDIGPVVIESLAHLLEDENDQIAFSALKILDSVNAVPRDKNEFQFFGIRDYVTTLSSSISITFHDSILGDFNCPKCELSAVGTVLLGKYSIKKIQSYASVIGGHPESLYEPLADIYKFSEIGEIEYSLSFIEGLNSKPQTPFFFANIAAIQSNEASHHSKFAQFSNHVDGSGPVGLINEDCTGAAALAENNKFLEMSYDPLKKGKDESALYKLLYPEE